MTLPQRALHAALPPQRDTSGLALQVAPLSAPLLRAPLLRAPLLRASLALCLSLPLTLSACAPQGGDSSSEGKSSSKSSKKEHKKGSWKGAKEGKEEAKDKPIPVEVSEVRRGDVSEVARTIALVEAQEQATLRALTSGVLTTLKVEEGAKVRAGSLLAKLDRPGAASALQKARAGYLKLKRDADRLKQLSDKGLSPVEEWRQAVFQRDQAALDLQRLRQEAGYERVESPIKGVVTRRMINRGEQVSPGQALFEVMDLSALRVPLHLPDQWATQLREGLKVRLLDRQERLLTEEARVSLVSPVVDAQSGTIKVYVEPPKGLSSLKPGLFVSAEVIIDTSHNTLTLPKHALLYRDDEPWVVLASEPKRPQLIPQEGAQEGAQGGQAELKEAPEAVAKLVKVTLGYTQGELVEVRSPLKEGDLVVSFGQRGLEEGAPLKLSREAP